MGKLPPVEPSTEPLRTSPCPMGGDSQVLCEPCCLEPQRGEKEKIPIRGHQAVSTKERGDLLAGKISCSWGRVGFAAEETDKIKRVLGRKPVIPGKVLATGKQCMAVESSGSSPAAQDTSLITLHTHPASSGSKGKSLGAWIHSGFLMDSSPLRPPPPPALRKPALQISQKEAVRPGRLLAPSSARMQNRLGARP